MRHRSSGSPWGPPACPHLPRVPHRWDPQGKQPQFHPFWGCPGHEGCRWLVQEEPQGTQAPLASCLVLDADFMPGYPSAAPQRGRSMNIHLLGEMASTHTRLSDSCQSPSPGRDAGAPGVPAGKDAPGEAAPGLCGCRMTAAGWEALGSGLLWGWALGYRGSFGAGHWDWGRFGSGCPMASCSAPKDPACPTSGAPCGRSSKSPAQGCVDAVVVYLFKIFGRRRGSRGTRDGIRGGILLDGPVTPAAVRQLNTHQ